MTTGLFASPFGARANTARPQALTNAERTKLRRLTGCEWSRFVIDERRSKGHAAKNEAWSDFSKGTHAFLSADADRIPLEHKLRQIAAADLSEEPA